MRVSIAVCLAAIILGAVYLSLQAGVAIDVPPAYEVPSALPQDTGIEVRQVEQVVTTRKATKAVGKQVTQSPSPSASPEPKLEPVEEPATITISVRDVVKQSAIESFRWRFQQASLVLRGESTTSTLGLALPYLALGDLLIEADGMQPFTRKGLRIPAAGAPAETYDIYLTPVATAVGITLMVKTLDNQPVANVRVDAYDLSNLEPKDKWHLKRPMWARRTSAIDGVYTLPPLPPGQYGILLVATTSQGDLLPLASFRRVFDLNGSSGFLEDVSLEPACALRLELRNGNGQPLDPQLYKEVVIRLNPTGQVGIQRKWTVLEGADDHWTGARTVSEVDRVPGKGVVWVDEPMSPGAYLLEVVIDGIQRVSQQLHLRQGEQQLERVTIF